MLVREEEKQKRRRGGPFSPEGERSQEPFVGGCVCVHVWVEGLRMTSTAVETRREGGGGGGGGKRGTSKVTSHLRINRV